MSSVSTVTIVSRFDSWPGLLGGMRDSMSPRLTSLCDDPVDMRELPLMTTGAEPLATRSPLLRLLSLASSLSSLLTRLTHGNLLFGSGRSRILSAASSRSMAVVSE